MSAKHKLIIDKNGNPRIEVSDGERVHSYVTDDHQTERKLKRDESIKRIKSYEGKLGAILNVWAEHNTPFETVVEEEEVA